MVHTRQPAAHTGFFKSSTVLILILLLSSFLRLYQLSQNPPGLIPDEANFGYQAYSVMTTGKTIYGDTNFLAFPQYGGGSYPPMYTFTLIPFIKLFSLSLLTLRLPSALFGIALSYLMYVLVKQLLSSERAALVGAFLMAVNPWALFYSRQGRFEMIGLFLVLFGMVLFVRAVRTMQTHTMLASALLFGISMHANDAAKIVTPILVFTLVLYKWKPLSSWKKGAGIFLGTVGIFVLLMLKVMFVDGQIRNYTRSQLLTDVSAQVNYERNQTTAPLWLSSIVHNKATVQLHKYIESYTRIFSVDWFFVNGNGHMQESMGKLGQYHLYELPLFFLGLILLFKKKREFGLLLIWIMAGHLPGAITTGPYAPYRSIFLLPVPIIFSAIGAEAILEYVSQKRPVTKYLITVPIITGVIVLTANMIFTYFFDFPVYSSDWRYRQRTDMLRFAIQKETAYDRIFVNGNFSIEYAFLSAFPPREYQNAYAASRLSPDKRITLGIYTFGTLTAPEIADLSEIFPERTLFLTDGGTLPKQYKRVGTFVGAEPLEIIYEAVGIH